MITTVESSVVFFQDYNANSSKQYRTYAVGRWAVFQWGRTGTVGQFSANQHGSPHAAHVACRDQIAAKMAKGYTGELTITFQFDEAMMDGSKVRCVQLDDVRQAASGNPVPPPVDPQFSGQPVLATPVPAARDPYGEFTDRALAAITLAVTDPRKGAEEFALLNAAWPELEQIHNKARSYLNTLDSLVIGVTA